jgi:hypothetical protein
MANSKEIVIKIEGVTDLAASGGAQIVECNSTGKSNMLGPLAKGLNQNSTWNATVLNDKGTVTIPNISISTYYLIQLVGTLPAIVKSDDLNKSGEVVLKRDPNTVLAEQEVITDKFVKPPDEIEETPASTEDGARFEYEINNDVKKSRVSVSLYGILQHNGVIVDDKLIGTSEIKKYKKGDTGADSIEVIASELKRQIIYDSQNFIQYKYDTYIETDKVKERNAKKSVPSKVTKAEAEAITKDLWKKIEAKRAQDITPTNVINTENKANSQSNTKKGALNLMKIEGGHNLLDADPAAFYEKIDKTGKEPKVEQIPSNNQSTNISKIITDNSVKQDKDGNIITYSNSKTQNISNNSSNEITNSIVKTGSPSSDDKYKDAAKANINTYQESQKVLKDALGDPTIDKAGKAAIKKELAAVTATLKQEIANYNKEYPDDKTYQSAGAKANVTKTNKKISAEAKTEKKAETKSADAKTGQKLAEPAKTALDSKQKTESGKSADSVLQQLSGMDDKKDPEVKSNTSSSVEDIQKIINQELDYDPRTDAEITDTVKSDSGISAASEKSTLKNQPQPKIKVKKEKQSTKSILEEKPKAIESKTVKELTALNNNIQNLNKNPVNIDNGSQITNTNTNNNNTNPVDLYKNPRPASKPGSMAKETKEKPEPVDNSQSALNSQLLHAIYDLLSTGIKVKYS